MSDLPRRLRASLALDAINGDATERSVCARQMMEAAISIEQLTERLAAAEASQRTDRINLVAWVLRNMGEFGCFSGDCPHDLNSECIQSIIDEYVAEEAKAGGGE